VIYNLSLQTTGLAAGILVVFTHAFALFRPEQTIAWAKAFPRSRGAATVLLGIAAFWSFLLVQSIDLGEFSPLRNTMLVAIVAGAVLSWIYVPGAYVWVIAGLFYVGMPYLLRDAIQWVTADRNRLKLGALAGTLYGLALVVCALAWW